jgi:HD-GYP domain-containing protein (c-di-GMP phosphodiesterase class II)
MSARQAWGELQAHAGTQFDEQVVTALLDVIGAAAAPPVSLT